MKTNNIAPSDEEINDFNEFLKNPKVDDPEPTGEQIQKPLASEAQQLGLRFKDDPW